MASQRKTTCVRDCPDACGIIATIEDGRVTRLRGDPEHPITRGFLCQRTTRFLALQNGPVRLTGPLVRSGEALVPISWDAALDLAAERLTAIRDADGPASILHYRSGGSLGLTKHLCDHFFEQFGPVTIKRGDICSGAGEAAQELDFGVCDSHALEDLRHARQILLWGKNVAVSSPHTLPVLRAAKAGGAELVLIDPVHHRTAALCDAVLQPRPGGDFALAMAVARRLFERGGVDPEASRYCDHLDAFRSLCASRSVEDWCAQADVAPAQADDLARRLAAGPTAILVGWGMARRAGGGGIVRALDALGAISGNLGIAGGGVSYYFARRAAFDTSFVQGIPAAPRTVCEPTLGADILAADDPPIRAVWVTAGNPVAMLPDSRRVARALSSRELVVVVDSFLTDTAALADLVLPCPTFLEADDLVGAYGHHHLGVARPLVPPPAGVRSDLQILQGLASRVGLSEAMAGDARHWQARIAAPRLAPHGVTLEQLEAGPVRSPLAAAVLFADRRFPTPSGRVNLIHALPPTPPTRADADYPLLLMALSTPASQSSVWSLPQDGPLEVTVHPDRSGGLADGALGRLQTRVGELPVRVRHDPRQRRDVAIVPKGGHLRLDRSANALIHARTTDIGEGGALYDEPARLVR